MDREIKEFLAYIANERGLSPKTGQAYRYDLGKFVGFAQKELGKGFNIGDVDQYVIKAYMQFLADYGHKRGNSAITRSRKLATLKSFFKYLEEIKSIKVNPAKALKMPKITIKEPSYLTELEYKRLLRTVKNNATKFYRQRDVAVVMMLLGMGLRLSELVGLDSGDVNFEDGTVKVRRKGNHERILPANDGIMIALKRYLSVRKEVETGQPLFLSSRNRRISSGSVWHLVKKYLRQARIEKEKLSPHTLRHTFATALLKQGENLLVIKELMSHRNLRTTERYLHINKSELRDAVTKINLTA